MAKRLVVCLDGTWNSPDQGKDFPTNVVKMMRAIRSDSEDVPQIVFYDAGVGTDGSDISRAIAGTFGEGLDQNVKDGYRFLANNWERDDEIYLFGFSRGAFTARSLCGFMATVGLLKKSKMHRMREAWEVYRTKKDERDPDQLASLHRDAKVVEVAVKCLGVWDTVGALGVPGELLQGFNRKYQFHDTELCGLVEHAFQALAIDEKRGPFGPTLWQREKGKPLDQKTVEQVWFPGVHSNVGGSYEDAGLSDVALEWMIQRVRDVSKLTFDDDYMQEHVHPNPLGEIYESRSALYTTDRLYPYQRLIGQNEIDGSWLRRWRQVERRNRPHEGFEFVNEMIHWSAVERFGKMARENGKVRRYEPESLAAALRNVPIVEKPEPVARPAREMLPAAE